MINNESIYKYYDPTITPLTEKKLPGYWFVFSANALLISEQNSKEPLPFIIDLSSIKIEPARTQHLGTFHGHPCYCAEVAAETNAPDGMSFIELRSLYGSLEENLFLLAGRALQIVTWNQTHQYCSKCGALAEKLDGEMAKKCPACGFISYPRIYPAVITAILKGNQILLARNVTFKGSMHSLIAGFVEPGETLEECVEREIMEEVNIKVKNIRYFGSQSWPFPHSMMIGFTAEYESGDIKVDGVEICEAGWFNVDSLPKLPSALSIARKIINWYIVNNNGGSSAE